MLLVLALLIGCGGSDGETEGTQIQSTGGVSGAGGLGGHGGTAGTSPGAGGSGQAGSGGSGQAGEAGSRQAGEGGAAGAGQAGNAGSEQAGEAGAEQAGDGGTAGSGEAGQSGNAGSGQGGALGGCCKEDKDCTGEDPVVLICAGGQCKLPAAQGKCWRDKDCGSGFICLGEFVCPCGALCGPQEDVMGYCGPPPPECCEEDAECVKQGLDRCVKAKCRAKLLEGQCWDASDCSTNQVCQNPAPCPCGLDCDVDSPGQCVDDPVESCCKDDKDCGTSGDCVGSVCKKPAPKGQCWEDDDCPAGLTCEGEIVCPCGAQCILSDAPGKCL
ncbi:MAG: hypothetical protein NZX77_06305 [Polyangiaceae bacterium]|nr:hypothetical protein [Polyangiaceae bacterium]